MAANFQDLLAWPEIGAVEYLALPGQFEITALAPIYFSGEHAFFPGLVQGLLFQTPFRMVLAKSCFQFSDRRFCKWVVEFNTYREQLQPEYFILAEASSTPACKQL